MKLQQVRIICDHTSDIESIKRASLVTIRSFKNFDKVTLFYDNYPLKKQEWKLRVRVDQIPCNAFRKAIKEAAE